MIGQHEGNQWWIQDFDCHHGVRVHTVHTNHVTTETKRRKSQRAHLKKQKRHKDKISTPRVDTELDDLRGVEEDYMKKEERRKSIREKLERGQEYLFTKLEERDIHERAEIYSMSVSPDEDHYIPPDEQNEDSMIVTATGYGHHRVYQVPQKRKRRNYMSDSVFLTYHNESDPYDNSHKLPIGSKLMRPPDKLVELVAQAMDGSPDGLLQVPQIYTVVQNRYPYFRYMDRAALGSWRSSIRHALYQKWFRKIRFGTHAITTKGCYWANNHTYVPVTRKEETASRKPNSDEQSTRESSIQESKKQCFDDFELDPDTHDKVIALLTEEEEKELELDDNYDSLEDVVCIAKEYGISLAEYGPMFGLDQSQKEATTPPPPSTSPSQTVPSPVREPDPILSTCVPDWHRGTKDHMLAAPGTAHLVNSPAILPVSVLSQKATENNNTAVFPAAVEIATRHNHNLSSPVIKCVNQDFLRLDYSATGLLSDPQMGMGPASQSSECSQFVKDSYDTENSMSFDIEQLPGMYNSEFFMTDNYFCDMYPQCDTL